MTNTDNSFNLNTAFSCRVIRKALKSLEPSLGRATIDAIIYDLEIHGLPLNNDLHLYTIREIKIALEEIFRDSAPLIMERLLRAAQDIENAPEHAWCSRPLKI